MSLHALKFRIVDIDFFERSLTYRMPFRFGSATVTNGVQAFVRARIRLDDGREAEGASAELMVPKWFDKDPGLSNDDNIDQLRRSLSIAKTAYTAVADSNTAFGHFAAHADTCLKHAKGLGLPSLAAAFGPAEVDKAVLDAVCRAAGISFFDAIRQDVIGFVPSNVAPDTDGIDARAFLHALEPRTRIDVRHTIGMVDPLNGHPGTVNDGLPESLEEVIAAHGTRWFKLKLSGRVASDLERLREIARVLEPVPDYGVTLDGNEQFSLDALTELLGNLRNDGALERLCGAVAFVEQPLPRWQTLETDAREASAGFALLIDEADATIDAFPRARTCGYSGVSSKSCKGLYKSLVNALRCVQWNAGSTHRFFMSGEDLTTPAGLALQQDLALVSLLGITHVERNGHHYINGMANAPTDEQYAFLKHHPDLYESSFGGVRPTVRDGSMSIRSLRCPGFASGSTVDWASLKPMSTAAPIPSTEH